MIAGITPDELRILRLSAPALLRMFEAREKAILGRIYGEYRNGKKDFLPDIAEYAVIREQISDLRKTLNQGD